uniref:ATP synthase complex subunit 8 n=1 Tax=Ruspolia yunnana TaxID=1255050 RepID=A0A8K1VNT5_9ORTH|nr:ATP synthase F0 subunit 8 [Ruspolia yunnana]
MPQMAPMSWFILFILFSFSLILFTMLNYPLLSQMNPSENSSIPLTSPSLNWKW